MRLTGILTAIDIQPQKTIRVVVPPLMVANLPVSTALASSFLISIVNSVVPQICPTLDELSLNTALWKHLPGHTHRKR
jgi:hypothetical protein